MDHYILFSLTAFIVNGSLALYGLSLNPRKRENRIFAVAFLFVVLWNMGEAMMRSRQDHGQAIVWAKLMYVAIFAIPSGMLHFFLVFTNHPIEKSHTIFLVYIPALLLMPTTFTSFIVKDVVMTPYGYDIVTGPLFSVFSFIFISACLLSLYIFYRGYSNALSSSERNTFLIIIMGCAIPIVLGSFTNLFSRILGMEIPKLGTLFSVFVSLSFIYAIRKHKFLIVPVLERKKEGPPTIILEKGISYLVEEKIPIKSYEIFCDLVSHGVHGMIIARTPPFKIRRMTELEKTPILWLTGVKGEGNVMPQELSKILFLASTFLKESPDCVVLLEGFEYLIYNNDFGNVLRFLYSLNDYVSVRKSRLILSLNPKALSPKELSLIRREMSIL